MDPGSKNFAWALFVDGELENVGWLKTLPQVEDDAEFINYYTDLLVRLNPDFVILERFMVRNRGQSVESEKINQMIGRICVISLLYGMCDVYQITAAQWKNWYTKKKKEDWHEMFSDVGSVHQRDAAAMGRYAHQYWIDKKK